MKGDIWGAYLNFLLNKDGVLITVIDWDVWNILAQIFPKMRDYLDEKPDTILVKIIKALYELMHSTVLCFNVLTMYLWTSDFKYRNKNQCIVIKKTVKGEMILIPCIDGIITIVDNDYAIASLIVQLEKEYTSTVVKHRE